VKRPTLAVLLLSMMFVGSVLSLRHLKQIRPASTLEAVLYIPSPKILEKISLGYGALVADIYWTRAVQYFGSEHHRATSDYKLLPPLLDIATTLDPKLIPAYDFGSIFLASQPPLGAGEQVEAVNLLQRGIKNNPEQWKLYQDIGFIYYMELKDYKKAAEAFKQASEIPGAHPFLKIMAARTLTLGGDFQTSQMLWESLYDSSKDPAIRDSAVKHLRALYSDEEVSELEARIQQFRARTGHLPAAFQDMVDRGYLRGIPRDPKGNLYILRRDGSVQVENYKELPFITKGLPPGVKPSNVDYSLTKPS